MKYSMGKKKSNLIFSVRDLQDGLLGLQVNLHGDTETTGAQPHAVVVGWGIQASTKMKAGFYEKAEDRSPLLHCNGPVK